MKFIRLMEKVLFFFVCASIALLGIGRLEIPLIEVPFRTWSVSRVAFFSWVILKLLAWRHTKQVRWPLNPMSVSVPLLVFAAWVTASLLPEFDDTGDYRYLMFAIGHFFMVVDVFDDERRQSLLYSLLALTPGLLLFRGVFADPSILNISLTSRFAYPLAHPNPAGYLLSMSIPLCLAVILSHKKWLRPLAVLSLLSQVSALILTFSRTAWIASTVSLLGIGAGDKRLRAVLLAMVAIGLLIFGLSGELRDRLMSLTHATKDSHMISRADVFAKAISVGVDSPLLGAGYGRDHLRAALKRKYPESNPQGFISHSHNLYAELIAGIGFLGLAIFLAVPASAGIQLMRKLKAQAASTPEKYADLGLLGSLIAFVIAALGDIAFYHHEPRIFFFTLLGLICLRLCSNPVKQSGPE